MGADISYHKPALVTATGCQLVQEYSVGGGEQGESPSWSARLFLIDGHCLIGGETARFPAWLLPPFATSPTAPGLTITTIIFL